ncbi:MAG: RagB/SusD family nutrient uptake outer membrane protein, partial [Porphyromonadaceae bacterium]|nr:RagB/SusD family nutrient uptake outer membrane protein [Porphyromonadaceae bacterium]
MKKKILYFLFMFMMLISSCTDFLDEPNPNAIPSENYFTSPIDVEKAVNGIYQSIRSNNCLGEGSSLFTEERSDNTGRLDNQSNAGEPFQFTDFSLLPSNTYLKTHWSALYNTVSRTNFVISEIDKVSFTDENQKTNYKSEALFVRALTYFHLVRKWGDVPMSTYFLEDYSDIETKTYRVKKELVYNQIILDLEEALNSTLPDIQPVGGKGRTCKAAINGLLGQVYLTMGAALSENKQINFQKA